MDLSKYKLRTRFTYHNTSPNDRIFPTQWDLSIDNLQHHLPSLISNYISQVTGMSVFVCWASMLLLIGVEVAASTNTATTVVSKLMDMKSVISRFQSSNCTCHTSFAITL